MNKLRVAVIGGGAAGLCAARYLAARPDRFEPMVFEKSDRIGGTWVYTDKIGKDKYGLPVHSSMYSNLRTNIPKEVMAFPDFPFDSKLPSYLTHTEVLEYMERYMDYFGLQKHIQYCKNVDMVRPLLSPEVGKGGEQQKVSWEVSVSDVGHPGSEPTSSTHDAVMLCNGHFSEPKVPHVKGLETFPGCILHSHDYRLPSAFRNQTLLLIGAGQSGIDIAVDMATDVRRIYLSHWKPRLETSLPENVIQTQDVESIDERLVTFTDGTTAEIDSVMYCTGYEYTYPFLHPDCKISVSDERVSPLYKEVIHTVFPSLSIIGIARTMAPFLQFSVQAQFAVAALDGSLKLPSRQEMEEDEEQDYQRRLATGLPHRHTHVMGERQWAYHAQLLNMIGAEQHRPVLQKIFDDVAEFRNSDSCSYKDMNFRILDDESYEIVR